MAVVTRRGTRGNSFELCLVVLVSLSVLVNDWYIYLCLSYPLATRSPQRVMVKKEKRRKRKQSLWMASQPPRKMTTGRRLRRFVHVWCICVWSQLWLSMTFQLSWLLRHYCKCDKCIYGNCFWISSVFLNKCLVSGINSKQQNLICSVSGRVQEMYTPSLF